VSTQITMHPTTQVKVLQQELSELNDQLVVLNAQISQILQTNTTPQLLDSLAQQYPQSLPCVLNTLAELGNLQAVKYLLPKVSPSQLDMDLMLMNATEAGHVQMAEYLVAQGANMRPIMGGITHRPDLFCWALDQTTTLPDNLCLSEALYHAVKVGNISATTRLHSLCTDPFEYCLAEDNLEVLIQLRELTPAVTPTHLLGRSVLLLECHY
jgi:hypothetical protein